MSHHTGGSSRGLCHASSAPRGGFDHRQAIWLDPCQYPSIPHPSQLCASDGRYEEAFTKVLSLADVEMVAWVCAQMDPAILSQVRFCVLRRLPCACQSEQVNIDRRPVE